MLTNVDNNSDTTTTSKKTSCIEAILSKDIQYKKNGKNVKILEGTKIHVDIERKIALINGDHMDIETDEYSLKL